LWRTLNTRKENNTVERRLYYHKTDGGAEYLTDRFVLRSDGGKEGVLEGAQFIVRIDGDITFDAEIMVDDRILRAKTQEKGE